MACVSCGVETEPGVLMCKICLDGILDPMSITKRMQDPAADMRLQQVGSAVLRIGPVPSSDLEFGEGVEPAIRLRSLMERGEHVQLQGLVEEYLASAGISLHVWGDERVPRRTFLWRMVQEVKAIEVKSEIWARASVRMGNLHSLLVLAAARLPVDKAWQSSFIKESSTVVLALYSRAKEYRPLWKVAQSNQAMLYAWIGRTDDALRILDDLCAYRVDKETVNYTIKRAMVLTEAGRGDECREEVEHIPEELLTPHLIRMKRQMEARR
jgi:hypothetical protein